MTTIKINNAVLEVFSSIKELPITRYKAMQNYLLQDSGIGSSMEDVDRHLGNAMMFLAGDKKDALKDEITNIRYSFYSMLNGIDYKSKSFACLVNKVDEKLCTDMSGDGLDNVVNLFSDASYSDLEDHWNTVKKKLIPN